MSQGTHNNPRPRPHRRARVLVAVLAIAVGAVTLAACGSSGKSGSSSTTNSASATANGSNRSGRFAALRACLQKEGITLPSAPQRGATGAPPQNGGGFIGGGGGFKPPAGVSQTKFREALKKCGAGFGRRRFNSATRSAALTKFSRCMRENGVSLPAPNTSGKGPIFNTKGINTSSSSFKAAESKCRGDLGRSFGPGNGPQGGGAPGGGAPGGPNGAPPAEGTP